MLGFSFEVENMFYYVGVFVFINILVLYIYLRRY